MATVHLYTGDKEITARTLSIPKRMNVESIAAWYKQCCRVLRDRHVLPLTYESVEITDKTIKFGLSEDRLLVVDRRRPML